MLEGNTVLVIIGTKYNQSGNSGCRQLLRVRSQLLNVSTVPSGGELLQILSQQDQARDEEEVGEPVAAAAAHTVGEADGVSTDGRDEELHVALAAETDHKVSAKFQSILQLQNIDVKGSFEVLLSNPMTL